MLSGDAMDFPTIKTMRVVPVAGYDSFLLNLSGGHAPWFTRCVVVMEDSSDCIGLGEVPASPSIIKTLEHCIALVENQPLKRYKAIVNSIRDAIAGGKDDVRGNQTFDQRTSVHVITAIESALLDLVGQAMSVPVVDLLGRFGQQRDQVDVLGYLFLLGDPARTDLPYPIAETPLTIGMY